MGARKLNKTYHTGVSPLKLVFSSKRHLEQNSFSLKKCINTYPYGFNGMERDDEVKMKGNSYSAEYRFNDPRLGRWLSIDMVIHHHLSPYNSMDNNPIRLMDPEGSNSKAATGKVPTKDEKVEKTYVVSQVNDQNETFVTYVKIVEETKVNSDGSYSVTTTVSEMTNVVYNGEKGTDSYKKPKIGDKMFYQKATQNYDKDGNETTYTGTEWEEDKDGNEIALLKDWTNYIHKSNSTDGDRRPYNQKHYELGTKYLKVAFAAGMIPFGAAGFGLAANMGPLTKSLLGSMGASASVTWAIWGGSDLILTVPMNYGIVHSVGMKQNDTWMKIPKKTTSKDDKYCGPTSFRELFDPDKWAEWWNGEY